MKKIFLILLVGFFAVVIAACNNLPTLESISIEGQDVEFYVGEEFNTEDLVVTAKLSDASTEVVTSQAQVSHEVDTNTPGSYTVTVTYKGLVKTYTVTVLADTLLSLEVEGLNTEYSVGEELSFEGVTAKETYESGRVLDADLSTYEIVIKAAEKEYTGAFCQVGENTVVLKKEAVTYEFKVNVAANLYSSIAEAVEAAKANADKVSKGQAIVDNEGYVQEQTFAFGENYTNIVNADGTNHYFALPDGTVFGLVEGIDWEGNPYVEPAYEPLTENLLGPDFRAVLNYNYDIFGVEGLVDTLAFVGATAINYQEVLPTEVAEKIVYGFSYELIIEDFYYYFVNAEFTLDANTDVITSVNVEMKGWMYVYNEETGENEQPTEFVTPDFTRVITVNQEIGERNAENPYPLDKMFIQSFDVEDAEGNKLEDGATITAPLKENVNLAITNLTPETANASIDQIKVTFLDETGFETWSVFGSYEFGYVTFTAYQAGNYQLVISSANVNYTYNLVVDYSPIETFAAAVYNDDWMELVEADSATVYVNQVLQFGAVVNSGANKACQAVCEGATIREGEYLEFVAPAVGTYVITLTSEANPELTATLTVNVEEAPSLAEILNGKYQFNSAMLGTAIYEFTPEAEGATKGQLVITYEGAYVGSGEGYFNYEYVDGWLQVNAQNAGSYNCPFGVQIDEQYNLLCTYNFWAQGELVKYEETEAVEGALVGIYAATFVHPMNGFEFLMELVFAADGTGTYSLMNNAYEGTFKYTNAEGVITFSEVTAIFGADVELTATIADNVITAKTVFTDAGNELELAYTGGAAVQEEATTTPVVGENVVFVSMMGTELIFTPEESGSYTISIDGTIAGILIESTDEWYLAEYTLDLEANVPLQIVIVTATWSTPDQNTTLTITKN